MSRALTENEIQEFRDRLCAVATRRFAELGYEGVTMRGLAQEMGCSPMTPYRYFESKQEIFAAVRAAAFRRLGDACEAATHVSGSDVDRAAAASSAYLEFALAEPDAYKIMFELTDASDADYPDLRIEVERARHFMLAPTQTMVEARVLDGDAETIAHMFWAGMHGVIMLYLNKKLHPSIDVRELYNQTAFAIGRGVRGPNYHRVDNSTKNQARNVA